MQDSVNPTKKFDEEKRNELVALGNVFLHKEPKKRTVTQISESLRQIMEFYENKEQFLLSEEEDLGFNTEEEGSEKR